MEKFKRIVLNSCAFTVISALSFLALAKIAGFAEFNIDFFDFLVLLLFGATIAIANTVFEIPKLHIAFKVLIHYVVVFVAFYLSSLKFRSGDSDASTIFVALVIFTFVYALLMLAVWLVKKMFKTSKKQDITHTEKKSQSNAYTPRYK